MSNQPTPITEALYQYWLTQTVQESEVLQALRLETQAMPNAEMQIAPEQGQFMHFLTKLLRVRNALEIGTFTGYSAICIASALPTDGTLIACDQSVEWTAIAARYFAQAQLTDKINLRIAPAMETLKKLQQTPAQFDLIFIDADKISYADYYDCCIQMLHPNGILLLDNMFFGGGVADPENQLPATRAIRALNARLTADPTIDYCLLSIGDGLGLVRKVTA